MKEYALYDGDAFVALGTIKEIAKEINVKEGTLKFYKSNVYKKRAKSIKTRILIELEEEENETM